ncbi:unnamed protein product [Urochloa humidicola]
MGAAHTRRRGGMRGQQRWQKVEALRVDLDALGSPEPPPQPRVPAEHAVKVASSPSPSPKSSTHLDPALQPRGSMKSINDTTFCISDICSEGEVRTRKMVHSHNDVSL